MKLMKKPIFVMIVGVIVGVAFGDKLKPMLQKIPMVGGLIK
jgi:hypothetical protein